MKSPIFTFCQFCGAFPTKENPLSKTHIWPRWINKSLEIYPTCDISRIDRLNPLFPTIIETKRHQDIFTFQPKISCRRCNGGWMNDIEQNVMDYLRPIISNKWPDFLSPEQAHELSLWLALICINAELASPLSNTITKHDRDYIREKGSIPNNWSIIIGKNVGSYWRKRRGYHNYYSPASGIHRRLTKGDDKISYDKQITTFGIGALFAQVVSSKEPFFSQFHSFYSSIIGFDVIFPLQRNSPLLTANIPTLTDENINFLNQKDPWFLQMNRKN